MPGLYDFETWAPLLRRIREEHPDLHEWRGSIGVDEAPSDLTPLVGLPRLRTLEAYPGKIADPLVIGRLTRLEYLEIGLAEWRALLDADAVPRSLRAAGISGYSQDPDEVDEVYDALTRLWGGTGLQKKTIEGDLR